MERHDRFVDVSMSVSLSGCMTKCQRDRMSARQNVSEKLYAVSTNSTKNKVHNMYLNAAPFSDKHFEVGVRKLCFLKVP